MTDKDIMHNTHEYKFAETSIQPIKSGRKTVTFQYNGKREVSQGDEIRALTPDGHHFAWLRVKDVEAGPATHAYAWLQLIDGQHDVQDGGELIELLNEQYDDEIGRESIVQGIHFEVIGGKND